MLIAGTNLKRCPTCKSEKDRSEFGVCRSEKSGLFWQCKQCTNFKSAARYASNPEKHNRFQKAYKLANPEKVRQTKLASDRRRVVKRSIYQRDRYQRIKSKQAEWTRKHRSNPEIKQALRDYQKRYYSIPTNKVAKLTKTRFKQFLKRGIGREKMLQLIGLNSRQELVDYIESKFKPGMNWGNHAKDGWHIDHIKPLCSFDLMDQKQMAEAFHYTNLQPLWWHENLSKGGRVSALN